MGIPYKILSPSHFTPVLSNSELNFWAFPFPKGGKNVIKAAQKGAVFHGKKLLVNEVRTRRIFY